LFEFWDNRCMTFPLLPLPDLGDLRARSDAELMQRMRDLAAERRRVDAQSAQVAGELARRSDVSLGYGGLAVRTGARTVEKLVSNLTGVSVPEARSMVSAGTAVSDEWLQPVTAAVSAGEVGVGTAAAIRAGLGEPNADIDAGRLAEAARRLAGEASGLAPEEAGRRARRIRDELDAEGVVDREVALREKRYLRLYKRPDGMTRVDGLLDPESAAIVVDAIDRVTMPRRGGPRFVDPAEQARETAAQTDNRTLQQLAADAFVQFVRLAAAVDTGAVFGVKAPAVRVHVRLSDLQRGTGAAFAEGQDAPLAMGTVHRFICAGGVVPILFDDRGQSINVGRTQRPFTRRQRIAIAARDGGCMHPSCDRPPSWTEAHHIDEWGRGGRTDVDRGIALCRHHHMWLHNIGGRVSLADGRHWLHPGDGSAPVRLESKHPLRLAG
jgi:hypothetical protein